MKFSPQQEKALQAVAAWLKRPNDPVFRLFGYAGTGKTTLARDLASGVEGRVLFGAFTGKAAHVLRQKGCPEATTIHSLIYNPVDKSQHGLQSLVAQQKRLTDKGAPKKDLDQLEERIAEEKANLKRPAFSLNPDSAVRGAKLVIIDECSMVDERMGEDLLSFGTKVLVLGDPAQLPPVGGGGFFTSQKPHSLLTEVHRQAEGNPIIELATRVRNGKRLEVGEYGDSLVIRGKPSPEQATGADQIIVGRNKTRFAANARVRSLLGLDANGPMPVVGDKLVCLRNDHEAGLLNGAIWWVSDTREVYHEDRVGMSIHAGDGVDQLVEAHAHHFRGDEESLPYWERREAQEFDYGYALTCHKSQGSQWDDVLIINEAYVFRKHAKEWLYTAITRAAERVTVVL